MPDFRALTSHKSSDSQALISPGCKSYRTRARELITRRYIDTGRDSRSNSRNSRNFEKIAEGFELPGVYRVKIIGLREFDNINQVSSFSCNPRDLRRRFPKVCF